MRFFNAAKTTAISQTAITPLLHFRDLSLARNNATVLHQINWTVRPGEHWLVSGGNGAGKSTLAEAITGKHPVRSGTRTWPAIQDRFSGAIRLVSFTDSSRLFNNANAVHYYQQRFNAFDSDGHLTVRDYLLANGHDDNSARAALASLGAEHLLNLERIKLSSGQTRKLLLAKALAGQPELLIIDNPYLGLDAPSRRQLNQILTELTAKNKTSLILIANSENPPACISHRLHLRKGRVISSGPESGSPGQEPSTVEDFSIDETILHRFSKEPTPPPYDSVIKLQDVSVSYGDKPVLNKLNWTVGIGEKWLVSGNNGSGKSTLLSLIYADHPQAYANQIYLFDHRRGRGESIWDIKRRIGFTSPELHSFFDGSLTARQVILSGLNDNFSPPARVTPRQSELLQTLIDFSRLDGTDTKTFRQFSTGEQRLLLLLRALIKLPPVLLLDEPFQGLDPATIERCRQLLNAVLTPQQTLIFISHFREEVPETVTKELKL